jgi:hypothetical protein
MKIRDIFLLFIVSGPLYANSLNRVAINENFITSQAFNFFVTGHMYGMANKKTPFPSGTILANIENINAESGLFFISLGDIYDIQNKTSITNFKKSFLSKIEMPVYNAVGNHDVVDRKMYLDAFNLKSTFYYLKHKNSLFVFLDTELNDGKIIGNQKEFFQNILLNEANLAKNIFIFTHRIFWKKKYSSVLPFRMSARRVEFNQDNKISKLINKLTTRDNNVYVFSGDVGQEHLLPLMYHKDKHVHYMAIGNSDSVSDALLNIKINNLDEVQVEIMPMVEVKGKKIKSYREYEIDKNNYYMTNLKDMSLIEKIFYFLKYPYFSALLFSIFIFILGYKLRSYRG